jgi:hypothetical protein
MNDVLSCSTKGTKNGTRNWVPVQLKKGAIKFVSSDYTKY